MSAPAPRPAVIIGAGPAGLATSYELGRRGIDHLVLERDQVAASWSRVYDSLTLHTGKHMSSLPGLPFPKATPLFIGRESFRQYLVDYRARFDLPVREGTPVTAVHRDGEAWRVATSGGEIETRAVVVATGIMATPRTPGIKGSERFGGRIRHSVTYRSPEECRGKRVLVVGAGNSAGEIASELGRAGVDTTIAVRSGANVVPLQILGVPIQYLSIGMRKLPRTAQNLIVAAMRRFVDLIKGPPPIARPDYGPLDSIPMIGFKLVDAIRDGRVKLRGGIDELTGDGARFTGGVEEPFDEIILATGFRATVDLFGSLIRVDRRGFAVRKDRVASADHPSLFFVGHNYDSTGALFNIRRDAGLVAEAIRSGQS
ncbi:MAG TPA: NAD(P)/FAD-dependent oxidoreductase [Thermoanaerobaculia bacterium]|nr:NAD(P)/FAD-dependent oxidoreductase [Thermoanaerobaculia bacterium]